MKKTIALILFLIISAAIYFFNKEAGSQLSQRKKMSDFTQLERQALKVARQIIDRAYFGSLTTIDEKGNPKVRLMEPFTPDSLFVIYLATNPRSRKVQEIKHNPLSALHYIDNPQTGYVSLYGKAYIVDDDSLKHSIWKPGWEKFYPDRDKDYILIKFIPDYLELISVRDQINGDSLSWQPLKVHFLKH